MLVFELVTNAPTSAEAEKFSHTLNSLLGQCFSKVIKTEFHGSYESFSGFLQVFNLKFWTRGWYSAHFLGARLSSRTAALAASDYCTCQSLAWVVSRFLSSIQTYSVSNKKFFVLNIPNYFIKLHNNNAMI